MTYALNNEATSITERHIDGEATFVIECFQEFQKLICALTCVRHKNDVICVEKNEDGVDPN